MNYLYNLPKSFKPKYEFDLIRLGRNNDGGYLIGKNTIKTTKNLISLGIYDDWSFEKDFGTQNKFLNIQMYDNQLSFSFLIKRFFSQKYFKSKLSSIKNLIDFVLFAKNKFKKKTISKYNFKSIINKLKSNIFLKIDIEGDEYQLLEYILQYKNKLSGIAIEFHRVDLNVKKIDKFIKDLGFYITNIHINNYEKFGKNLNPKVIEITLEKNPRIIKYSYLNEMYLNQKNNIYKKEPKIIFV
jgi:hypothetical protein